MLKNRSSIVNPALLESALKLVTQFEECCSGIDLCVVAVNSHHNVKLLIPRPTGLDQLVTRLGLEIEVREGEPPTLVVDAKIKACHLQFRDKYEHLRPLVRELGEMGIETKLSELVDRGNGK